MKEIEEYFDAICAAGAGPMLIETGEEAEWLKNEVESREVKEILPGDEDFDSICDILDLTPANNPKRVFIAANYNQEAIYYALAEDWNLA